MLLTMRSISLSLACLLAVPLSRSDASAQSERAKRRLRFQAARTLPATDTLMALETAPPALFAEHAQKMPLYALATHPKVGGLLDMLAASDRDM